MYISTTLLLLTLLLLSFRGNLLNVFCAVTAECFLNSMCWAFSPSLHYEAKGTVLVNCSPLTQDSTTSLNRLPAELLPLLSRAGAPVDMADIVCAFPGKK